MIWEMRGTEIVKVGDQAFRTLYQTESCPCGLPFNMDEKYLLEVFWEDGKAGRERRESSIILI